MTDKIIQIAPKILEQIDKAQNILLCCHPRPDPDSVASNLAMMFFLKNMGKNAKVISGDDNKPPALKILPGFDTIKNLNFGEIDLKDYDLFISQDTGSPSRLSSKYQINFPLSIPTIVIDHHPDNPAFGELNLIDAQVTSTCELIWLLFREINSKVLDKEIAECVFVGIWSDSGGFASNKLTENTFKILGECIQFGVKPEYLISKTLSMNYNQMLLVSKIISNSKQYFQGKVVITKVSYDFFKKSSIPDSEIGEIKEAANHFLQRNSQSFINSVVYEFRPGLVSTSLRAFNPDRTYDVSVIARSLNGGGHPQAAATKIKGTVDEAETLLLQKIQEYYPELGQP